MNSASDVIAALKKVSNKEKAAFVAGYFQTGKGQYGEGDVFWGITVPAERIIAKKFRDLPIAEVKKLLTSSIHEQRQTALMILGFQFSKAGEEKQKQLVEFCLSHTKYINNWDLVDTVSPGVIGPYFLTHDRKPLYGLAKSANAWERRIAIVSTQTFIRHGQFEDMIKIAELLLSDTHDLIHKAVGWMLREMGKKDEKALRNFLDHHAPSMPRTTLRYAIERFDAETRQHYLSGKSPVTKRE